MEPNGCKIFAFKSSYAIGGKLNQVFIFCIRISKTYPPFFLININGPSAFLIESIGNTWNKGFI